MAKDLSIILPAYNEGSYLFETVVQISKEIPAGLDYEIIISEDGSSDNTKDVIKELCSLLPVKPLLSNNRKGYALAVIEAIEISNSRFIIFMDSDRQLDPVDIKKFWNIRNHCNYAIGIRSKRADSLGRRISSQIFKIYYDILFSSKIKDPSCPFILIESSVARKIAADWRTLGERISEGFWWEFNAWAIKRNLVPTQIEINHFTRADGTGTKVYKFAKLPDILYRNILNIYKVKVSKVNE